MPWKVRRRLKPGDPVSYRQRRRIDSESLEHQHRDGSWAPRTYCFDCPNPVYILYGGSPPPLRVRLEVPSAVEG